MQFIQELTRVARRSVFMTTPNRWFTVEVHTVLPFVHWLAAPRFRAILRQLGHDMLSREENLNLTAENLRAMCREIGVPISRGVSPPVRDAEQSVTDNL